MKRIVIIGDIHGRDSWQKIVDDNPNSIFYFLGDYLDPYRREGISEFDALENFKTIIDFKKKLPDYVTLLLGNHDIHYLFYPNYPINSEESDYIYDNIDIFQKNKDLFTYMAQFGKILISHAGVTNKWFNKYTDLFKFFGLEPDFHNLSKVINDIGNSEKWRYILFDNSAYRGGYDDCSGIVWADDNELYDDHLTEFHQYVGHNKHKDITIVGNLKSSITFCDVLWKRPATAYISDLF